MLKNQEIIQINIKLTYKNPEHLHASVIFSKIDAPQENGILLSLSMEEKHIQNLHTLFILTYYEIKKQASATKQATM